MPECLSLKQRSPICSLACVMLASFLSLRAAAASEGTRLFHKIARANIARTMSSAVPAEVNSRPMEDADFRVVDHKMVYSGWRSVKAKEVQYPDGQVHSFDVMTTEAPSVFVFPWDTRTKTTLLLREYHPGVEKVMYGVVAGMLEPKKHVDALTCAQFELEEEAGVSCTRWVPLLHNSTSFDKYSDARLLPFLALDCLPVENPRAQDNEEYIQVLTRVTHKQVLDLILRGEMNVPSSFTSMLAFDQLRRMNLSLE